MHIHNTWNLNKLWSLCIFSLDSQFISNGSGKICLQLVKPWWLLFWTTLSKFLSMQFGFAEITLQLEFKERLCLRLVKITGVAVAVAVSARIGMSGKNALTAARSLNSFLNSTCYIRERKHKELFKAMPPLLSGWDWGEIYCTWLPQDCWRQAAGSNMSQVVLAA